ncbi:MAG TPA: anaerobic glycerol-3-phosphate dehydrogenase subunit A [Spirochaetota bacterium]|nr:anaerobic glycerol-3-phosphate dehydrogenase subunit A [Spirochaetota bacterium]HOS39992.1 anaerobic glycerol-3-phosphate dehydrogenase subunit A [Spirochaetota bacterium]HPU89144.1 anaerobic glycerol-3-phosphate dehydrogenase subunit A [Spirochaetota bacterium]
MTKNEFDVIIIGGGATGAGIVRDCSLRGLRALLIEKDDIASGTTGRNHGLLHSGARYAVKDLESARECIRENRILKKIARHCIEDTGGLFVTLPDDDPDYHNRLLEHCKYADIDREEISVSQALAMEPNLNENIMAAIRVPDGTIDPFRLSSSNILDAQEHGARVATHTIVTGLIKNGANIAGVTCRDLRTGEEKTFGSSIIVNAAGVWGQRICAMAGIELAMYPSKGSMCIIDYRINNVVVNRSRMPADGDIIVPGDTVSIIGTTSKRIDYEDIEKLTVDDDEIDVLLADGEKLIPNVSKTRVLRAYCGVRPLVAASGESTGRDISRGIVLIDHASRDGVEGIITIAGGKLMTYRLMAQETTDLVCRKLNVKKRCVTHRRALPGSEKKTSYRKRIKLFTGIAESVIGSTHYRHGERVRSILKGEKKNYGLICECEMVTAGEIEYALEKLNVKDIIDLRRRTRIGMGPCQGELCSYRVAGLFNELGRADAAESNRFLIEFLEERWKGIKPILWGDALREIEFTYWIYQGLFGLGDLKEPKEGEDR